VTVAHADSGTAEAVATALRRAGHRVQTVVPGTRLEQDLVDSAPDLLVLGAGLGPPLEAGIRAVRRAFDAPVVVLSQGEPVPGSIEVDALMREPFDVEVLTLGVAGLLHPAGRIRRLRRRVQELEALYKISWAFSLEAGAQPLFGYLSEECAKILKSEFGIVLLYDPERRLIAAQQRGYGVTREQIDRLRYGIDNEHAGRWNFRKNGPLLSNNAGADTRLIPDIVADLGLRSVLVVPMTSGGEILGLLTVGNRKVGGYSEEDLELLMAVSSLATVAVENLRLHDDLKQANVMLQEYDRLKNEFVAMVAHDFRKPLTAIRGLAELLMDEPRLPAETVQDYMRTVIEESDGLARLADDTLLITRIESENFEFRWSEVDLASFVLGAVPLGLSDHTVLVDTPSELPRIVVDAERLKQVLRNLVSNAIKYSPAGGDVTVRCRQRGHQVAIDVIDEGLGIPQDQVGNLFKKFERVRSSDHMAQPGTGLGLYICRLIVEGHGGQIWVDSKLGEGSTFGMVLPLDCREARERQRARGDAGWSGSRRSITGMFRGVSLPVEARSRPSED
jgi:signal transduction histidine kinase